MMGLKFIDGKTWNEVFWIFMKKASRSILIKNFYEVTAVLKKRFKPVIFKINWVFLKILSILKFKD